MSIASNSGSRSESHRGFSECILARPHGLLSHIKTPTACLIFGSRGAGALNAYHNRAIATHEVHDELIKLAKELDAATRRGHDLGLSDDEVAFTTLLPRMNPQSRQWVMTSSK